MVESRCGAVMLGSLSAVAAPFGQRCLNRGTVTPFPHPAHRTGHADFPHPALGQDSGVRPRKALRQPRQPYHPHLLLQHTGMGRRNPSLVL